MREIILIDNVRRVEQMQKHGRYNHNSSYFVFVNHLTHLFQVILSHEDSGSSFKQRHIDEPEQTQNMEQRHNGEQITITLQRTTGLCQLIQLHSVGNKVVVARDGSVSGPINENECFYYLILTPFGGPE